MPTFEIAVGPAITENLRTFRTTDRRLIEDPATSNRCGSITYDRKRGKWPLEWANEEEFLAWRAAEESDNSIELIVSHVAHSDSPLWRERRILRCSREWTGGWHKSGSTASGEQDRKIPSKKTGCRCCLTIKLYRHTDTILGKYETEHDHPLGDENLRFTRLSDGTRDLVMAMVHTRIDAKAIVSNNLFAAYLANERASECSCSACARPLSALNAIITSQCVTLIASAGSSTMKRSVSMRTTRYPLRSGPPGSSKKVPRRS
jgi:hypothetical protein